mgnify:CR=1 FL=1
MCASTVRCPPMRPHPWERVLSHYGTRRTDTKHQECCATIMQILPPAFPEPHGCAQPSPSLVVRCGHESSPGLPGIDDAELRTFQMAASCRLRAVWLSRNEAVSLGDAWGTTRHGEPGRVATQSGGRPLASESARIGTAETTRALEEERPSVETQGEKYGSHR